MSLSPTCQVAISSYMCAFVLLDAVAGNAPSLVRHFFLLPRHRRKALEEGSDQDQVNYEWRPRRLPAGKHYSRALTWLFIAAVASPGAPIVLCFVAASLALEYWQVKLLAYRVMAVPERDPSYQVERGVGACLLLLVAAYLAACWGVYSSPALVQSQHLLETLNPGQGRAAIASMGAQLPPVVADVAVRTLYVPSLICACVLVLGLASACLLQRVCPPPCASHLSRVATCGKMGQGMHSLFAPYPERFLPAFTQPYRQLVREGDNPTLTDINKRQGWALVPHAVEGSRLKLEALAFIAQGGAMSVRVQGELVPQGVHLSTVQLSAVQGSRVSYSPLEDPLWGGFAQALALAESEQHVSTLLPVLPGRQYERWTAPEDVPHILVQRDGSIDMDSLISYAEAQRRGRRAACMSSKLGGCIGRSNVLAFDHWSTALARQLPVACGCCDCFALPRASIDSAVSRARAAQTPLHGSSEQAGGSQAGLASQPSTSASKAKATGLLSAFKSSVARVAPAPKVTSVFALPRHPDDSSDDEPTMGGSARVAVLPPLAPIRRTGEAVPQRGTEAGKPRLPALRSTARAGTADGALDAAPDSALHGAPAAGRANDADEFLV